jgi:hypothetical protein
MHVIAVILSIILCFLGAWLLLYLDHRAKFHEVIVDIPGLLFAMIIAGGALAVLYELLKFVFEPAR